MTDEGLKDARDNFKLRENMTPGQIVTMFNHFAQDYDRHYKAEQRSGIKVLDVAAGTGAVGVLLKKEGFRHIDALDPAEKMLEVAMTKGVYQRIFCEYMDGRKIPNIDTDNYDVLTVSSGFNIGLIPLKTFSEMIRVVKPGGLVVTAIPDMCRDLGYQDEFLPVLSRMEDQGLWEKVVHLFLEDGEAGYKESGPGMLYAYRVKVTENND